ncbi:MAG: hypothetical protein AAGI30_12805 [Planctomycetota bacterium]
MPPRRCATLAAALLPAITTTAPAHHDPALASVIAAPGDPAPGADGRTFHHIGSVAINDLGDVAITATAAFSGNRDPRLGVWADLGFGLELIVLEGAPAPELPGAFVTPRPPIALGPPGDIAIEVFIADPFGLAGDGLVTASGYTGELTLVALETQPFDVSPAQDGSDRRIVASLGAPLTSAALNARSEFAFSLHFADESAGVFVKQLPCAESDLARPHGVLDAFDIAASLERTGTPEQIAFDIAMVAPGFDPCIGTPGERLRPR